MHINMQKLPIYNVVIDDNKLDQGVGFISLVDEPAIMVDWVKLANETSNIQFTANKDKQLLHGPFLIPDMLIYRADEKFGEYYVRFSKEQIEKIANKFNSDLNNKNLNFQHSDTKVNGTVVGNWLIDGKFDKSQNYGFSLPEGTWFGTVKVSDSSFWENFVKTDKVKGFSVEILADLELQLQKINNNMEDNTNTVTVVELAAPVETTPAADTTPVAEQPATPAQTTEIALTREDVSNMIDARFQEIMTELSNVKVLVEPILKVAEEMKNSTETYAKKEEIEAKIKGIEEKLSITPATTSITQKMNVQSKSDKEFDKDVNRIIALRNLGLNK